VTLHHIETRASGEQGFSVVESLVATAVLMVVCGTVMKGVLGLTDVNTMVSNRTDMHNGVRNATELLTQEVGQAGRISLPGPVTLAAVGNIGQTTITVDTTDGMFLGLKLLIGTDNEQETVTIAAINGGIVTMVEAAGLRYEHLAGTRVSAPGGFAHGIVPTTTANGSTGERLKIFGDIHDDGNMVYVEYWCDLQNGRLYRNSMPFTAANKPEPTVEQILIDNIEANPDGTPCFTYQQKTVTGTTFVIDVAITLTVRTQQEDKTTGDFQRETKALLNVSPRNVFNTWQMASLDIDNRVQLTPPSVTLLLPNPVAVEVVDVVPIQ
jgi:type II secretory pathway pseudopilin PulG